MYGSFPSFALVCLPPLLNIFSSHPTLSQPPGPTPQAGEIHNFCHPNSLLTLQVWGSCRAPGDGLPMLFFRLGLLWALGRCVRGAVELAPSSNRRVQGSKGSS